MNKKKVWLPVAVLLVAGLTVAALVAARPEVEPVEPERVVPVVRVLEIFEGDVGMRIESQGTVEARRQSEIVAEVAGRILSASPEFAIGGTFRRGEQLVQLDARDYRSAVSNAEAAVARARTLLAREEAEAEIAAAEWEELGDGNPASPLVLREPQIREARAAVAAAEAGLSQARNNLARATITAPFSGRILRKMADVGQFVAPGTPIATMYASDYAEVTLPVTSEDLGFIDLSTLGSNGPRVSLIGEIGGAERRWDGRIVRTTGQIDPQTRMASLVARIENPFEASGDGYPLQIGLFVEAEIEGVTLQDAFVLPREALRTGDRVFVLEDGKLSIRDVGVVRTSDDEVTIGSGLANGDRVIVSPIEAAVEGMSLRAMDDDARIDGRPVEVSE